MLERCTLCGGFLATKEEQISLKCGYCVSEKGKKEIQQIDEVREAFRAQLKTIRLCRESLYHDLRR